ncbi:hypothetical protein GCM10023191_102200 [Actinoallomurus oryzae]|uniref:Uncharacterized protein n=1 Tax=Actinoallomurus oryzae TaxID=502180 RepID=A0ABP8RAG1_9ACTN
MAVNCSAVMSRIGSAGHASCCSPGYSSPTPRPLFVPPKLPHGAQPAPLLLNSHHLAATLAMVLLTAITVGRFAYAVVTAAEGGEDWRAVLLPRRIWCLYKCGLMGQLTQEIPG